MSAESTVDPLSLAVVRGRLEQIADEMDTVFERMAFSPVISDAWDRADGIYSPTDGSMIVQGGRGLPIFVAGMLLVVAGCGSFVQGGPPEGERQVNGEAGHLAWFKPTSPSGSRSAP